MGFNKKKIVIFGVLILIIFSGWLLIQKKQAMLVLKSKLVTVEYGQAVSTDPKDYLNLKDVNILKDIKLRSNVKNEVEKITNPDGSISERDKGYAKVGDYLITLTYKNEIKSVKVIVRDTICPELNVPQSIEILEGTDLSTYDFKSLISVSDLSEVGEYIIDTKNVDINIPGKYSMMISIEDASKNRTEKEIEVVVLAKLVNNNENMSEIDNSNEEVATKKKANNSSVPGIDKSNGSDGSSLKPNRNENSSNVDSPENDSSSSGGEGGESNKPSGQYVMFYYCLDHFKETFGKYHTLDDLINAGHYTGGCGCNNYGFGEEWVEN